MKIFLNISKYAGAIGGLVVITWSAFTWVDNRQDNEANINEVIYEQVIPKLNYLIKADSASKVQEKAILARIDSVGDRVETNTKLNKAVIESYTNWVKSHVITTDEFIEYMEPFMMDLDDIKKNDNSNRYQKPLGYYLESVIPIPQRETALWQIPPTWIPQRSTDIIIENRN